MFFLLLRCYELFLGVNAECPLEVILLKLVVFPEKKERVVMATIGIFPIIFSHFFG